MKYQYRKHSVSKHERDRLAIEEQRRIIERLIKEAVWLRSYVVLETRFEEPDTKLALGDGCYWKRQLMADY